MFQVKICEIFQWIGMKSMLFKKKETNIEQIHRSEHQFSVILFRITITEVEYRVDKAKQT